LVSGPLKRQVTLSPGAMFTGVGENAKFDTVTFWFAACAGALDTARTTAVMSAPRRIGRRYAPGCRAVD
jgi:hypothetical protein